jgi:hypothetical protein
MTVPQAQQVVAKMAKSAMKRPQWQSTVLVDLRQ